MKVEVRFYATLRRHTPPGSGGITEITANEQSTVEDILRELKVDLDEVKLIMVNGRDAPLSQILSDQDRLGVFPPVGGG